MVYIHNSAYYAVSNSTMRLPVDLFRTPSAEPIPTPQKLRRYTPSRAARYWGESVKTLSLGKPPVPKTRLEFRIFYTTVSTRRTLVPTQCDHTRTNGKRMGAASLLRDPDIVSHRYSLEVRFAAGAYDCSATPSSRPTACQRASYPEVSRSI